MITATTNKHPDKSAGAKNRKTMIKRITHIEKDINSEANTYRLDVKMNLKDFKELCTDLEYHHIDNKFGTPIITKNRYHSSRPIGITITHFEDHLEMVALKEAKVIPEKIFAMALIANGEIMEYINADEYKGSLNNGLYKMHIATQKEVIEFLKQHLGDSKE